MRNVLIAVGAVLLLALGFFVGWYWALPEASQGLIALAGTAVGALAGSSGTYYAARAQERAARVKVGVESQRSRLEATQNAFIEFFESIDRYHIMRLLPKEEQYDTVVHAAETPQKALATLDILCPKALRTEYAAYRNAAVAAAGGLDAIAAKLDLDTMDEEIKKTSAPLRATRQALAEKAERYFTAAFDELANA